MKKIMLAALAACAFFAFSCTDDGEGSINESNLVGTTWYMVGEEYHPIIATFEKGGKYTWEYGGITGMKDTGTYTIKGNVITMNITDFWEIETDWIDGVPGHAEGSEWTKVEAEYTKERSKTRTATIYVQEKRFLIWGVENDWFMAGEGSGPMVVFMSDDVKELHADKEVSQSDLQGEWEARDSKGTLYARMIVEGNKFTSYSLDENHEYDPKTQITTTHPYVSKDSGTFSLKGGKITINIEKSYTSMEYVQLSDEYRYSGFDANTLEATEWLSDNSWSYSMEFYVYREGKNLYYGMSMHGVALTKK